MLLAIEGVLVQALPTSLREGTYRVERIAVEDGTERDLKRKVAREAERRRSTVVLISDTKQGTAAAGHQFTRTLPQETYCYALFSSDPLSP
jgi:hypothetical protein